MIKPHHWPWIEFFSSRGQESLHLSWFSNNLSTTLFKIRDFPGGSEIKASACNAGDLGLIPGLGRFPGEGNGNPLQYSCLENSMDRGAWWATVHGVAKSQTRLSDLTMDTVSLTKEARICNGEKTTSLTSGAGKTGQPLVKE